jgi:hypothetical protein
LIELPDDPDIVNAPSIVRISVDMTRPGMTFTTTTVRHVYQPSIAPIANGASASPTFPPMP